MPPGAASWSFTEHDFQAITQALHRFLYDSKARCALLVDRAGQLVATVGDPPAFDATAFASLTAADFSANDQLARLIGERDFTTLFHEGERDSMLLADVARRIILVVLFDGRTTLGLVRLKLRPTVDELGRHFEELFARPATAGGPAAGTVGRNAGDPAVREPGVGEPGVGAAGAASAGAAALPAPHGAQALARALGAHPAPADLLAGAEDEIDRLFA